MGSLRRKGRPHEKVGRSYAIDAVELEPAGPTHRVSREGREVPVCMARYRMVLFSVWQARGWTSCTSALTHAHTHTQLGSDATDVAVPSDHVRSASLLSGVGSRVLAAARSRRRIAEHPSVSKPAGLGASSCRRRSTDNVEAIRHITSCSGSPRSFVIRLACAPPTSAADMARGQEREGKVERIAPHALSTLGVAA